jgi:phenylalanyl-tRNA synthetase beta chain
MTDEISYNWLKHPLKDWNSEEAAALLTDLGLEVVVEVLNCKGLEGIVVGRTFSCSHIQMLTD